MPPYSTTAEHKGRRLSGLALAFCLCTPLSLVFGDVHYVSVDGGETHPYTNWATASQSIQAAIDAAESGDTVLVSNGIYNIVSQIDLTQAVSVVSVNGADATVVDAGGSCRCFYLRHTNSAVNGFTITRGAVTNAYGGGVYMESGGTLRDCVVTHNSALTGPLYTAGAGGGIFAVNGGHIENCAVATNTASDSGGGACLGPGVRLLNCTIQGNRTTSGNGGGVYWYGAATAESCRVSGNQAGYNGGGFFCEGGGRIVRSTIENNSGFLAGGIFCQGASIIDCQLRGNHGYMGGGVFSYEGSSVMPGPTWGMYTSLLQNCVISGNHAERGGGVLVNAGGHVMNCTVAGNFAGEGGGIYCDQRGSIINTLVWNNSATNGSDILNIETNMTYAFCSAPLTLPGEGNMTNAPEWTPSYRLKGTSPCIDAGTESNAPPTDIDGEARWDHPSHSNNVSSVDIGADEFVDTDLDSMADYWETVEFGNITDRDGTADADSDALNDLDEYENSTAPTNSDSDADQMPDGWEVSHALNPLSDDANGDPDWDNMRNLGEYISDTDPHNGDSVLMLIRIDRQFGGIRLDWKGGREAWQILECRENLASTTEQWNAIFALPPPTALTNAVIDMGVTNGMLFYRIRAER